MTTSAAIIAVAIIAQHFFFDWILQPRWVAVNKSKNYLALLSHGLIVTVGFSAVAFFVCSIWTTAIAISLLYGVLHMVQDKIVWGTYKPETENPYQEKSFWNRIAYDQFIHLTVAVLLLTRI